MPFNCLLAGGIAVLIVVIWLCIKNRKETVKIKSSDGEYYHVLEEYGGKNETAEMFAEVNSGIMKLLDILKSKYRVNMTERNPDDLLADDSINVMLRGIVQRVITNYNYESLFETEPTGKNGTSYTVEKGEQLHMCVRRKDTLTLHSVHDVMFVALHELAHMGNEEWGHGQHFWEIFKFILHEAKLAGIHEPERYDLKPIEYCGLRVDYNPYFDRLVKQIY